MRIRSFISHKPCVVRPCVRVRAVPDLNTVLVQQSALIGKGLTLFVLFTSSLNWWLYREIRMKIEEDKKDTNKNNKQKDTDV